MKCFDSKVENEESESETEFELGQEIGLSSSAAASALLLVMKITYLFTPQPPTLQVSLEPISQTQADKTRYQTSTLDPLFP